MVDFNVQDAHAHFLVNMPPELSIPELMDILRESTVTRLFKEFTYMSKKPYWGNHFWVKDYCVDFVGWNSEMIQKYVEFQGKKRCVHKEQLQLEVGGRQTSEDGSDSKFWAYLYSNRSKIHNLRRDESWSTGHHSDDKCIEI